MMNKKIKYSKFIGVTGFARSGKDTFYQRCEQHLLKEGKKVCRFAFADALKDECDELLKKNTGISAFTEDPKEKELIRPLLVIYGTEIRRKLDQNCWIKKIQQSVIDKLMDDHFVFITDVRFRNEAEWVKMNGGMVVNIAREGVGPANHDEHRESHHIRKIVGNKIYWPSFGEEDLNKCDEYVLPFVNFLLRGTTQPEILM